MAAWRYDLSLLVLKNISRVSATRRESSCLQAVINILYILESFTHERDRADLYFHLVLFI